MVLRWRINLAVSDLIGRLSRWVIVDLRAGVFLVLLVPTALFAIGTHWEAAAIAFAGWLLALFVFAASNARNRLVIGEFKDSGGSGPESAAPAVDLSNLLLVELSRLADLFRVVGDRRAVASELGDERRALDATLSVDALVETLEGNFSAEKASLGPISIPIAPFAALFGKLVQPPRLTGNLHRDGDFLILTAQTARQGGLSWRVETRAATDQPEAAVVRPVLSRMVEELALRIYTDLALGRSVRWEASAKFVKGLHCFRSCLRTPKDRKVNLQYAEDYFLGALAEDEDFPLAYYNLGVVYTELHGLAVAAGRDTEAKTRLSAAETSFGRAIEKDPARWECYFAFAQTQFRYERFESVVELCEHVIDLKPSRAGRAKTYELWARALVEPMRLVSEDYRLSDDYAKAVRLARRASRLALESLVHARLIRQPSPGGEDDPVERCEALASGCLLTFSDIYSIQMPSAEDLAHFPVLRWHKQRIKRRSQALEKLAPLSHGKPELHFKFGRRALARGLVDLAEAELAAAVRAEPTRPAYCAALAHARATRLKTEGDVTDADRAKVIGLCLRALQGMAGAFFPSRDASACAIVARVYDTMGSERHGDHETATQLRIVAGKVQEELERSTGGASVSGAFLEALQSADVRLASKVGEYGEAAQRAVAHLNAGQGLSRDGIRTEALGEFREALQWAEVARSLNPLSTLAWETLGDIHRERSDFQNARFAWEQALGTDPDNPELYDKIGSTYWHLASEGRPGSSREELEHAAEMFDKALKLYPSGSHDERILTHYRLGKLHAELRNFGDSRQHLEIVNAVGQPPILGWLFLAFAYLETRNFAEAQSLFRTVVGEGERLDAADHPTAVAVGDRLDEEGWPLGLVRTWGHLGLALTHIERDGDPADARSQLESASAILEVLSADSNWDELQIHTRAPATLMECRGLILLAEDNTEAAIAELEQAVSRFPHSRSYLGLARALEQRAMRLREGEAKEKAVGRALRLLGHAVSLGPGTEPSAEVMELRERLTRLGQANGTRRVA